MNDQPLVTIILPIRNEARYIARALDAVLGQDYPGNRIEILVVDGMSIDGTREVVGRYAARDQRLCLLDNPARIVPTGLNLGLRAARGDIVIRVDGHAVIASDYVRRCVADLARVVADCVGGPIHTRGETWAAAGIAIAQSSPFGVGNAAFRYATHAGYVDTIAFGAYHREVFDRIGIFDEELVRNQDDEFNFRLTSAGGRIWLDPEIRSTYYSRSTLRALWRQYLEYGFWKVRVMQKHGRPAAWRHLVPGLFVLALLGSVIVSLLVGSPLWVFAVMVPYVVASLGVSLVLAARRGWQYAPILPVAFATMHLAYGLGFWMGLITLPFLKTHFWAVIRSKPDETPL